MLEIKNVTKIYKTKGGVDTRALDDVSISFGETGLVFLLGKSGSGKSTLLNVSGGLDEPTSGEIIVKGKSSKNFSGSDFDSYRNTFVGFIFQEYNILDEFNVEDNIALALELQGKPKDMGKISAILREVELEEYAKRKPNTLSGGQKQRIAIARALVKDPQIIMADEPTGALDSATGKQVFDTLKKLSQTRLVIVVSHDREFAEIYGDRIVELKDGKIISDVSKTSVPPESLGENISVIGGNTLSIKSGSTLTKENFEEIQKFVSSAAGNVIISRGEEEVAAFRKVNRMSDGGTTEIFENTDLESIPKKSYTAEQSKFIRSRLPAGKAIKIGASGLKLKPVRLTFTILLSFVAFVMFGLASTMMLFDKTRVTVSSFMESECNYLNISKYLTLPAGYDAQGSVIYYSRRQKRFTDEELGKFKEQFGDGTFGCYNVSATFSNVDLSKAEGYYYLNKLNYYAYLTPEHPIVRDIVGTYPQTENEICISEYTLDLFKNSQFYTVTPDEDGYIDENNSGYVRAIRTESDIIGKYVTLNLNKEKPFKVTGVFRSGKIPEKYDKLKKNYFDDYNLYNEYSDYINEGLSCTILVSEGFDDIYGGTYESSDEYVNMFDYARNSMCIRFPVYKYNDDSWVSSGDSGDFYFNCVKKFSSGDRLKTYFLGEEKTELGYNEVVAGLDVLYYLYEFCEGAITRQFTELSDYDDAQSRAESLYLLLQKYITGKYYDEDSKTYIYFTANERKAALAEITAELSLLKPLNISFSVDGTDKGKFSLAGFYVYDNPDTFYRAESGMYLSDSFIDDFISVEVGSKYESSYVEEEGQKYTGIMLPYDKSASVIRQVLDIVGYENIKDNDIAYFIENSLYDSVEMVADIVEVLYTVFLWVGIVFAVFSALLLFNFISVSISNKKKEIGILRAVGARGLDVFKIFFSESGIIVGICTVLALIGTAVLCFVINGIVKSEVGLGVTLFVFGIPSVCVLIGIAVLVAIVATFLPVYLASRKKPVDSIRAL